MSKIIIYPNEKIDLREIDWDNIKKEIQKNLEKTDNFYFISGYFKRKYYISKQEIVDKIVFLEISLIN